MRSQMPSVRSGGGRYDRPTSAVAAAAALLWAATSASAAIVNLSIDPSKSFVSASEIIDLTQLGGGVFVTSPQFPDPDGPGPVTGSATTSLSGTVIADITGAPASGTIALLPGSTVVYNVNNTPGSGGVPGQFAPFDPVTSAPLFPAVGATPNSSYGLTTGGPLSWQETRYDLAADFVSTPPRPIVDGEFSLIPGGDFLVGTSGRIAHSSAVFSDTRSVVGEVLAALGTGGSSVGTWDGATLEIPIESSFAVAIDATPFGFPGADIIITYVSNSSIVAVVPIPEPSAVLLLGIGILGVWAFPRRRPRITPAAARTRGGRR